MIIPEYLKAGDKVGLVSPAGKVKQEKIDFAIKVLSDWGLEVILGKNALNNHYKYAGTYEERLWDLQEMLDHTEIKAIFCSRGGYGTLRILDKLNFSKFIRNPKWVIGFSDITALHAHLNHCLNVSSVHGPMPNNFDYDPRSRNLLRQVLWGHLPDYRFKPNGLNRQGNAEGRLIGGNLALIYNMIGSKDDFKPENKILFIEDVGEYLYHIDRMMLGLKRAGKLDALAGLVVGDFTDMLETKSEFGSDVNEIIHEHTASFDYPVCHGFPAGHGKINHTLILNARTRLVVEPDYAHIIQK